MKDEYPKFQWSMFAVAGRNEQYVVRTETMEELKKGISEVKEYLDNDPTWIKEDSPEIAAKKAKSYQYLKEVRQGLMYGK